jgi:hypothetical protein
MEFLDIHEDSKVYPGEYLLHTPTSQIVMCGAFKKVEGVVKFLVQGRLQDDKVENFQKLKLTKQERRSRQPRRSCGGCKRK